MAEKVEFYKETEYRDTEIGRIPKDWEVMKLGNVITYVKGKKPKGMTEEHQREYFPYLSAEYLRNNKVTKFVEPSQDVILVNEGDLILLWDGSNAGEFFWGKQGILSSTMVRIEQEKPSYDQKFLFYLLKAKESFLKGQTKGTGIPHVNENVLNNLVIPDPPLVEQQKIAEILSIVDEAIQKTDDIIAKTERLKKGLMQELLTKGIGHKEFKDSEIGRIPKEWEVKKLKEIAEQMYYGLSVSGVETPTQYKLITTTSINKETFKIDEGKVPFCNLFTNEDKQTKKLAKYFVKKEDVLVSRSGTTGVVILVDKDYKNMLFGSYLIKIKLNLLIDPKFFWYFSQSLFYWRQISSRGATIKNINLPILKNLQVPLPSLAEQQKVSEILSSIDEKLENLRREKTTLEKIKQWFMDVLLTGKIRVIT